MVILVSRLVSILNFTVCTVCWGVSVPFAPVNSRDQCYYVYQRYYYYLLVLVHLSELLQLFISVSTFIIVITITFSVSTFIRVTTITY